MNDNLVADKQAAPAGARPALKRASGTPLGERLRVLQDSMASTRQRLESQDLILRILRGELESLKQGLEGLSQRAAGVEKSLALPDDREPAEISGAGEAAITRKPDARRGWEVNLLPCALLAVAGLALGLDFRRPAPKTAAPPMRPNASPDGAQDGIAPALPETRPSPPEVARLPENPAAPSLSEEEASEQVLNLVYAYRPPGSRLALEELLGPEIVGSAESESSPWVVAHDEASIYRVSFRPYGEMPETAPLYEFQVDLAAKTVEASPETVQNLRTVAYRSGQGTAPPN